LDLFLNVFFISFHFFGDSRSGFQNIIGAIKNKLNKSLSIQFSIKLDNDPIITINFDSLIILDSTSKAYSKEPIKNFSNLIKDSLIGISDII
jgi:hypothetical protein